MLLNNHSISRTLIPAVGAVLAGASTANPIVAAFTCTALSGLANELVSQNEGQSPLADGFREAISSLEKDLEKSKPEGVGNSVQQSVALKASEQAITDSKPSELTQLLAQTASRSTTAHLIQDQSLDRRTRELAENYLVLALNHWQQHLSANDSTAQALRELLAQHQQRLQDLAEAGLDFGNSVHYVHDDVPPSQMFRPESGVLKLIGREQELADLTDWCTHKVSFAVTARAAPGGTGKTRLALRLINDLQQQGWLAALVEQHEVLRLLTDAKLPQQILLVLDYADYRSAELETLLDVASRLVTAGHTVRLLLLARPDESWWNDAKNILMGSASLYGQLKTLPPALVALQAPNVPSTKNKQQILQQVAKAAELTLPPDANEFQLPSNSTPLMWMMAAYRFLQPNRQPHTEQVTELCKQMVMRHERDYIKQKLNNKDNLDAAMQALALFTFAGGVRDKKSCETLINHITQLTSRMAEKTPILQALRSIYPNYTGICPLRPDLLGEYLCEQMLQAPILEIFIQWCIEQTRDSRHGIICRADRLLPLVSAQQTADRLQQWEHAEHNLNSRWQLTLHTLSYDDIQALACVDTHEHLLLRDLMVKLSEVALVAAGSNPIRQAHVLNNRSLFLTAIGEQARALACIEQATSIYRKAAVNDATKYSPYLAGSLNNLAPRLSELGRDEDALDASQESVKLRRHLTKLQPEVNAPKLASSLNNLSPIQSALGKFTDAIAVAQESVEIYRTLATQLPDIYKPELASSLYNLANRHRDIEHYAEALKADIETVKLRRSLATLRPAEFNSDLSAAINNLAASYYELGKIEDAIEVILEAVDLRRDLAEQRPSLFISDLAESLNNSAIFLSKASRKTEALKAARESVCLYRSLAKQLPDKFTPNLAFSLSTLTRRLSESRYSIEACHTSVEASTLLSEMWHKYPSAFEQNLFTCVQETLQLFEANGKTVQDAMNELLKNKHTAKFINKQI